MKNINVRRLVESFAVALFLSPVVVMLVFVMYGGWIRTPWLVGTIGLVTLGLTALLYFTPQKGI